ncbi:MAG: hypothetical protein E6J00_06515, partial [Chloroflexi bacterium]
MHRRDKRLEHWQEPVELVRQRQPRQAPGLGTGGFGADVDQVRPLLLHPPRAVDRLRVVEQAVPGEGVGGQVEDAHHEGPRPPGELGAADSRRSERSHHRSERSIITTVKLSQLLQGVPVVEAVAADPEILGIRYDSRRLEPGDCFVAVSGSHTDGHRYVETALRDGAVAALVERRVGTAWPQVVVPDTRRALALVSAAFYHHPSRDLALIGVTGTDGKTTTTSMIHAILQAAGWGAAAMSTVDLRVDAQVLPNDSRQTTLEAPEIQAFLARARDARLRAAVLETSSHGLALHRVDACDYDLAVYTNITHEHLDFHGTFEAYREAKASLIDLTAASAPKGIAKTAVLNRDDPSYALLAQRPISRRLTYGLELPADVFGWRVASTV